jgi:hypothetical protein
MLHQFISGCEAICQHLLAECASVPLHSEFEVRLPRSRSLNGEHQRCSLEFKFDGSILFEAQAVSEFFGNDYPATLTDFGDDFHIFEYDLSSDLGVKVFSL